VSDEELARVNLTSHASHGEWNYTITPRPPDDLYTLFLPDSGALCRGSERDGGAFDRPGPPCTRPTLSL